MNPNSEPLVADLSLPEPQQVPHEHAPILATPETSFPSQQMPSLSPSVPAMPLPTTPLSSPIAANPQAAASTVATPAVADDNDLIEKVWVEKAKAIVASTKDDPYVQNREVNRFKAEYIKKRYNKDIKLPEA